MKRRRLSAACLALAALPLGASSLARAQGAILTRDIGVPQPLFVNALQRSLKIVRDFGEIASARGEAPKLGKAAAVATSGAGGDGMVVLP